MGVELSDKEMGEIQEETMKKWGKKASFGILLMLVMTLFGWFLMWQVVDFMDYGLDKIVNKSWENADDYENDSWYGTYSTFQTRETYFKQIVFWVGVIVITISIIAEAYNMKVQQYVRQRQDDKEITGLGIVSLTSSHTQRKRYIRSSGVARSPKW